MTSKTYSVFQIPVPASEEHISLYTRIRLRGLSTNPEAFGSTYARESAFTREIWTDRINTKGRTTFAAANLADDQGDGDWIGTLSFLGPDMILSDIPTWPSKIAEAVRIGRADVYMLVGMWVHPDYRRKGVGGQLVELALKTIRLASSNFVSENGTSEGEREKEKIVLLEVHAHNHAARGLYEGMGFVKQEELEVEEGTLDKDIEGWMALTMN